MLYILKSHDQKTDALLELARQDSFFASVADDLQDFGFEIEYPFWGRSSAYTPYSISMNREDGDLSDAVAEMKCSFKFSPRYGRETLEHEWLHELVHFHQDMYGLFLNPILIDGQTPMFLDQRSYVQMILFCEAMAEIEATLGIQRIKGKSQSTDLFDRWLKTKGRYYEQRAVKMYEASVRHYQALGGVEDVSPFLRRAKPSDILALLPTQPDYIDLKALEAIGEQYTACDNPNLQDIKIGSPVYVWKNLSRRSFKEA